MTCIKIQNLQSKVVRTLRHGSEMSGESCYTWDGADDSGRQVNSGYYYVFVADTCSYTNVETGLPSNNVTKGSWVFHAQNPTPQYTPGDANNDGVVNIGDAVMIVMYVFKGGPATTPWLCVGDVTDDGAVNVGDAVYLINFIFREGPAPRDGCA